MIVKTLVFTEIKSQPKAHLIGQRKQCCSDWNKLGDLYEAPWTNSWSFKGSPRESRDHYHPQTDEGPCSISPLFSLHTSLQPCMPKQSFTQDNWPWACDNPTPERKHRQSTFSSCWSSCAVLCTLHVYISPIQNWINSAQTVIAPHNKRSTELLNYNFLLCQNSTIL